MHALSTRQHVVLAATRGVPIGTTRVLHASVSNPYRIIVVAVSTVLEARAVVVVSDDGSVARVDQRAVA